MTDDPEMQALTLIDLAERLARGEIDAAQYQGAVGRLGGHASTELPEEADAPSLLTPDVPAAGMSAGDSHAYASWMANILNALELLGQDVEDIASDADDELDGSGWNVARNPSGHWSAVRDDAELASLALGESFDIWALLEAGGERAPKGGISLTNKQGQSKDYKGGMFIPAAALADLPPDQKAKLEQAKANAAAKAEKKTAARHERGSVDTGKLASRLQAHADTHPLSSDEKRWAASAARMLHRHHGAMTAHRIEELADRLDRALHEVGDDHPNSEGLRSYFGRQLAKLHQALGHAKDKGVTGEVVRAVKEPAATGATFPYEAKRSHQGEPIVFPKPIAGPNGTQLLSYDWKWEPFEEPDARGEEIVVRKVSDWTQAEKNLQTGKNVVHHFRVKTPDGHQHTVSLETALRMMGYTGDADASKVRGLSSAVKTLAKLRMELGFKQQQKQAYDDAVAAAKQQIDVMEKPAVVREPHPTNPDLSVLKMGNVRVFDHSKSGPISGERLQTLTDLWRGSRQHELIPADVREMNAGGMLSSRIDDLTKRISRAEKSVADASAAASATSPPSPTDAPGFTGIDAQGRQWQDGKLVAKQEEPAKDAGRDATDEPADDIPINSTQLPIDNKPGSGHNVSSDRSAPTGEKKMFAQPRTVFAVSGFNGPYSKQEQVMKALGVTWDAGASRNVVPEDKIEAAKAAGFKVEKREVAPPPPIPDEVASQLSRYGMNPDRYSPVNQFDKPYEQIARWLQEKHPVAIRRLIVRASSPEEKAALAQRLAEVEADPTTDQLPTRFEFFKKGAGTLKAGTATYGEIKAWRSTPNRIHRVENQEAFWTESPGARDGGHATVKHRKPGDTIDGIGVVADFRRIGDANEYLVRPFTKAEKRVNDQVVAAREATEIRSALGNPDSMFHPTTLEQEAEMRKRLAELDRIAAGLAK